MSTAGVKSIAFDSGEALLQHLLTEDIWERRRWIYRGQGNKEHELVPSALRRGARFPSDNGKPAESNEAQVVREWNVLKRFASFADHQGLPIPGLFEVPLHELNRLVFECSQGRKRWPPTQLHGLMALAQHYGVPTRALDWTRAPLVGLYFAAYGAAKENSAKSQVTLYALNSQMADLTVEVFSGGSPPEPAQIKSMVRLINVPNAGNPNIAAQQGTFTCVVERELKPKDDVLARNLEQPVSELVEAGRCLNESVIAQNVLTDPLLIELVAPAQDAGRLLRKLARTFNVMGTSVYPGFAGAGRSVSEMGDWDTMSSDAELIEELRYLAMLGEPKGSP